METEMILPGEIRASKEAITKTQRRLGAIRVQLRAATDLSIRGCLLRERAKLRKDLRRFLVHHKAMLDAYHAPVRSVNELRAPPLVFPDPVRV